MTARRGRASPAWTLSATLKVDISFVLQTTGFAMNWTAIQKA